MTDPRSDFTRALHALIQHEADARVVAAYQRGYQAGLSAQEADRIVYRRGYQAGYKAARLGREERPDGSDQGRARLTTIGGAA